MKFFDNVTGRQKVVLLLGGTVLLVGVQVLFPEAADWLITSTMAMFGAVAQLVRDIGDSP